MQLMHRNGSPKFDAKYCLVLHDTYLELTTILVHLLQIVVCSVGQQPSLVIY